MSLKQIFKYTSKYEFVLVIEIIIYAIIFSVLTIYRYGAFETYAYDLGIYNQAMHTTLSDGKLLYYTSDLTANPNGSLFGVHFSPIFLVILPVYAVHPFPETLLVIQSFVLSLGAIPLYLLAVKRLKSEKIALLISTLYLLNPALQGINWYDFHPEAFLPTFLLFCLYFLETKNVYAYFASVLLTLMTLEFASIVLIFMSLYFAVKMKLWRRKNIELGKLKILLLTVLLSVVWMAISFQIVHSINSTVAPLSGEIYWREIGANSLQEVPGQFFSHPVSVINALSFDAWHKLFYFVSFLGFVIFLPLLEPLIVICVLPWLSIAWISNYPPFYSFGDQYPAFMLPFLFFAVVLGVQKIKPMLDNNSLRKKVYFVLGVLLAVSIVLSCFSTPINGAPYLSYNNITYGLPQITEHDRSVSKLLEFVPKDAAILTQGNIFPQLSNRLEAYLCPSGVRYPPGETFSNELEKLLSKVDYIIVDFETDLSAASTVLSYASKRGNFGLYASADGVVILKRDYQGALIFFRPVENSYNFKSFVLNDGALVRDPDSKNDYVLLNSFSNRSLTDFWFGPYVFLSPGSYEATFRMKTDYSGEGNIVNLYVSYFLYNIQIDYIGTNRTGYHLRFNVTTNGEQKVLASRGLNASDFVKVNSYSEFQVNFNVTDFGAYEFRGMIPSNISNIFLDEVRIMQSRSSSSLNLQVIESFPFR